MRLEQVNYKLPLQGFRQHSPVGRNKAPLFGSEKSVKLEIHGQPATIRPVKRRQGPPPWSALIVLVPLMAIFGLNNVGVWLQPGQIGLLIDNETGKINRTIFNQPGRHEALPDGYKVNRLSELKGIIKPTPAYRLQILSEKPQDFSFGIGPHPVTHQRLPLDVSYDGNYTLEITDIEDSETLTQLDHFFSTQGANASFGEDLIQPEIERRLVKILFNPDSWPENPTLREDFLQGRVLTDSSVIEDVNQMIIEGFQGADDEAVPSMEQFFKR